MEGKDKETVILEPLSIGMRIAIVFMSWITVCLKPATSGAFLSTLFLASVTSGYEFYMLYYEYRKTKLSKVYVTGFYVSLFMLLYWFLVLVDMITLDVKNMVFKMGPASPIPLDISWPYYCMLFPAILYLLLIAAEILVKSITMSSGKKTITN